MAWTSRKTDPLPPRCLTIFAGDGITTQPDESMVHRNKVTPPKEVLLLSGYGGYGYGYIGFRRLLIFLLVIATIFVFIGC
jgi:hypothetical protein